MSHHSQSRVPVRGRALAVAWLLAAIVGAVAVGSTILLLAVTAIMGLFTPILNQQSEGLFMSFGSVCILITAFSEVRWKWQRAVIVASVLLVFSLTVLGMSTGRAQSGLSLLMTAITLHCGLILSIVAWPNVVRNNSAKYWREMYLNRGQCPTCGSTFVISRNRVVRSAGWSGRRGSR